MGAFPRKIWELPEARRSEHPWHSWIAYGEGAKELVQNHSWDRAHEPLERLAERGGWVVMVGVTIFYCTALHLAEERSGRRAFIRWAKDKNGLVKRISVGGCANWFDPFFPQVEHLFKWTQIGNAAVLAAPLRQLVEVSADLIHKNPQLAVCSSDCLKCKDALAGGPLEVK
jgi:aminoglycoside 3-N-acetyltransferase